MQRRNLLFRRTDIGVGIRKSLPAQRPAHPRTTKKQGTQAVQNRRHRHRPTRQPRRSQQQQIPDSIGLPARQFNGDGSTHRRSDDAHWLGGGQVVQELIEVVQHSGGAIRGLQRSRGKAETEQIRDEQLK